MMDVETPHEAHRRRRRRRGTLTLALGLTVAVVTVIGFIVIRSSVGVSTGSIQEFCADYAILNKSIESFDPKAARDLDPVIAELGDMRYPASLVDDANQAVDSMKDVRGQLEGVDVNSDEAQRITRSVDMTGLTAIDTYGKRAC